LRNCVIAYLRNSSKEQMRKVLTFYEKGSNILLMKGLTLQQFQEGFKTPVGKLSKRELLEREEFWRALWSWIPDEVKYYIYRVGQLVRVYLRNYKGSVGELGSVKFDCAELELEVYEKVWNETTGKYIYEQKTLKLPYSAVMWLETITEQTEADQVEVPEVQGLESLMSEE